MMETATPVEQTLSSAQLELRRLKTYLESGVLGQENLVERLLIALLADGHLLVEGVPGLAKTRAISLLAQGIEGRFHRVQFTPDLLPADLTGTEVYRPQDGSFKFQEGPLFHNLILADEINRAPAKVQSALLEAMAERQITVGHETYPLPKLFLVMATQNPLEQEGTYPLPEAQLDRFLLHVKIGYPPAAREREILQLVRREAKEENAVERAAFQKITMGTLFDARREVLDLYMADALEEYLLQLVLATRDPAPYSEQLKRRITFGVSPRATIALDRVARARAWLRGRNYVTPDDIQSMAHDVLRHRLILAYEAEAEGVATDAVINELLQRVPVP